MLSAKLVAILSRGRWVIVGRIRKWIYNMLECTNGKAGFFSITVITFVDKLQKNWTGFVQFHYQTITESFEHAYCC